MGISGFPLSALFSTWCERGDSNPHGFPHQILNLARLPVPPLSPAALWLHCSGNTGHVATGPTGHSRLRPAAPFDR